MPVQERNSDLSVLQSTDGFKYGLWTEVIAGFQALPGLVGFWPMSSVQRSTGNVFDLSGQSRTLTYHGNPTFSYTGLVPHINLDGTGDYLSRTSETDLVILGNESIYSSSVRGLTMGAWINFTSVASTQNIINKNSGAPNISYALVLVTGSPSIIRFAVSGNGSTTSTVDSAEITTSQWYYVVGRYKPSTEVTIFINDKNTTNTSSIPASLFGGTQLFTVGCRSDIAQLVTGSMSLCFLSANYLSDSIILGLYQRSRLLFGV